LVCRYVFPKRCYSKNVFCQCYISYKYLSPFSSGWVSSLAGFYSAVQSPALNFNCNGTLFIILGKIVTVLVFASLDLAIKYGQVKLVIISMVWVPGWNNLESNG
jgi:hypothetical protein